MFNCTWGPEVTTKTNRAQVARLLSSEVAGAALVSAATSAAIGDASVSSWYEEVRTDRAPKPVIQQPRFTRWLLADVLDYWRERASRAAADTDAAERMAARAKKASIKAREPAAVAKAQATRKARIAARERGTAA